MVNRLRELTSRVNNKTIFIKYVGETMDENKKDQGKMGVYLKMKIILQKIKTLKASDVVLLLGGICTICIAIIGVCISNPDLIIASIYSGLSTAISSWAVGLFEKKDNTN